MGAPRTKPEALEAQHAAFAAARLAAELVDGLPFYKNPAIIEKLQRNTLPENMQIAALRDTLTSLRTRERAALAVQAKALADMAEVRAQLHALGVTDPQDETDGGTGAPCW